MTHYDQPVPLHLTHTIDYALPVDLVYLAMTDPDSVKARSEDGGWSLITADRVELDDGGLEIDVLTRAPLPKAVRSVVRGDLVLRRVAHWRPTEDGYLGTVKVLIPHVPGTAVIIARGHRDTAETCRLRVTATITVTAPFIGRVLERILGDFFRARAVEEPVLLIEWLISRGHLPSHARAGDYLRFHGWGGDPTPGG